MCSVPFDLQNVLVVPDHLNNKLLGLLFFLEGRGYRLVTRRPIMGLREGEWLLTRGSLPRVDRYLAIFQTPPQNCQQVLYLRNLEDVKRWLHLPLLQELGPSFGWQQGMYPSLAVYPRQRYTSAIGKLLGLRVDELGYTIPSSILDSLRKLIP